MKSAHDNGAGQTLDPARLSKDKSREAKLTALKEDAVKAKLVADKEFQESEDAKKAEVLSVAKLAAENGTATPEQLALIDESPEDRDNFTEAD